VKVTGTTADRRHRDPVWRPAASSRIPLLTKADDLLREGASVPILGSVVGDEFAAVLTAAQSGSEAALTLLWRDANPALLRYLRVIAPDAADLALHNLATQRAIALVSALPPLQAEVIMLRVVAGLDTEAVAELLGRSPGAVRVAAHRGLRRLAGVLANAGVTL